MYSDDNADGGANIYSHIQFSWSFKHDDLKKAVLSLLVNDELQSDANVITMVKLIKDQFQDENEMFVSLHPSQPLVHQLESIIYIKLTFLKFIN